MEIRPVVFQLVVLGIDPDQTVDTSEEQSPGILACPVRIVRKFRDHQLLLAVVMEKAVVGVVFCQPFIGT